jgi:hypothetical protein
LINLFSSNSDEVHVDKKSDSLDLEDGSKTQTKGHRRTTSSTESLMRFVRGSLSKKTGAAFAERGLNSARSGSSTERGAASSSSEESSSKPLRKHAVLRSTLTKNQGSKIVEAAQQQRKLEEEEKEKQANSSHQDGGSSQKDGNDSAQQPAAATEVAASSEPRETHSDSVSDPPTLRKHALARRSPAPNRNPDNNQAQPQKEESQKVLHRKGSNAAQIRHGEEEKKEKRSFFSLLKPSSSSKINVEDHDEKRS